MLRLALLAVVVICLCSDAEGKKRKKCGSCELDNELDQLRQQVTALEERVDTFMSAGSADAATDQASCPSEKVHLHFHGEGEQVDHGSPDDTYVHIKLGVEGRHDDHDHHDHHDHDHDDPDHVDEEYSAHCEMQTAGSSSVYGFLHLTQFENVQTVTIHMDMSEFPEANAEHAIHVHQHGDVSEGCSSLGHHYDPFDKDVDVGDLGTVTTDGDKTVTHTFDKVRLSLFGPYSIIGRSVIIHDKDGAPMACCVIGWGKDNPDHDHHHDHHDHDDHDHYDHDHDDDHHHGGHGAHDGHKKH